MDALADIVRDIASHFDEQAVVFLIILLLVARVLGRIDRDQKNDVQISDFFSSKGSDGKEHGDPDKLAKTMGAAASTIYIGYMFWSVESYNWYVVTMFFGWLAFIAGIDTFAKWFRSLLDRRYGQRAEQPKAGEPLVSEPPK